MQKQTAILLQEQAESVAVMFSNPARGGNYESETFKVREVVVLSECTAAVIYEKQPTNKQAVAWFYYVNSRARPRWEYFFVTYSHLTGLERVAGLLHQVEQVNFATTVEQIAGND